MKDLFQALLKLANNGLVVVASFLYTIATVGMAIFGAISALPMPHVTFTEAIFNIFAFAVIYMLHRGLKDMQRTLGLKRLADTYVSHYRAQVLYQGGTLYATPGIQANDFNARLQAEADAVTNAILNDHRELTRKQVQEALAEHYGW